MFMGTKQMEVEYILKNVDLTGWDTSSASDYVHLRAMVNHNGLAQESGGKGIK